MLTDGAPADGVLSPVLLVGVYSRWKRCRRPSREEELELIALISVSRQQCTLAEQHKPQQEEHTPEFEVKG